MYVERADVNKFYNEFNNTLLFNSPETRDITQLVLQITPIIKGGRVIFDSNAKTRIFQGYEQNILRQELMSFTYESGDKLYLIYIFTAMLLHLKL